MVFTFSAPIRFCDKDGKTILSLEILPGWIRIDERDYWLDAQTRSELVKLLKEKGA